MEQLQDVDAAVRCREMSRGTAFIIAAFLLQRGTAAAREQGIEAPRVAAGGGIA